jgi:hypothetical protein
MIIGGQAVLIYGEPRLTKDIDVSLGVDVDRLADVLAVAKALQLAPLVSPQDFTTRTRVLPCEEQATGLRVDFIFSFSTYENEALSRTRPKRIGATEVHFASPEDVVIHKIVAGRPRDLEDVRGILLKNPSIDATYIRRWLEDFATSLGEPVLARFEEARRSGA